VTSGFDINISGKSPSEAFLVIKLPHLLVDHAKLLSTIGTDLGLYSAIHDFGKFFDRSTVLERESQKSMPMKWMQISNQNYLVTVRSLA